MQVQGGRSILSEKNWFEDRDAKKQRIKNRKSLGRRVSFAPDAHLETTHLYPKVQPSCTQITCPARKGAFNRPLARPRDSFDIATIYNRLQTT